MTRELLDSNLIRILHTLLMERSVSRTARMLGQTQPAVSVALRKLRSITGDTLLIRNGNGMVPTEHGLALLAAAEQALDGINRILEPNTNFDPAKTRRTFRIGSPDYLDVFFVPSVIERFQAEAPNAVLEIRNLTGHGGYEQGLVEGDLDHVIGNWPTPPENLHLRTLCTDELVCLVREDHPIGIGRLSPETYACAHHLSAVTRELPGQDTIDTELSRSGLTRRVTAKIPYFGMAPYVLLRSDLIFTTTRAFASHYANFLPLRLEPFPADSRELRYYQLWHERNHKDEGAKWLRRVVASVADSIFGSSTKAQA
ncbi:LysR family transcriptional regulator [Pandoraea captiosa]|uniref:LysR family transcriptional regulator n=1 Tax=Pandoraea captiosa TaxID=2508302 RepID=A0A5E4ZTF6_9BURK|nr:LysR family transcriptional regulator [Pandoraea captiosa]VVE64651.1 LysR family transcriptional regulator [Pandoraea captiosa]